MRQEASVGRSCLREGSGATVHPVYRRVRQDLQAQWDDEPVFECLIDHAALFPPASMGLAEALEEDARARAGEHGWVLGRFVVPASLLSELPEDAPPLSVVLREVEDAQLVSGASGMEAVELPLTGARPRSADLVFAYRRLQPLRTRAYFEL